MYSLIQSLSQINNIVVVPSKHQVTVHPQTGKKEYIFVDLAAVYPTPEEPGSELSFEELIAARRGWLDLAWGDETVDGSLIPEPIQCMSEIEEISRDVGSKLMIHRDPMLFDENGEMREQPREPRAAKKKKVMEVNETQISKAPHNILISSLFAYLISSSQGEVGLSVRTQAPQEANIRANDDTSYQSGY